MTKTDEEFYLGIIVALAAMEPHQQDTIYDEVVNTVDLEELLLVARKHGHMRWSGLSRHLRRNGFDKRT